MGRSGAPEIKGYTQEYLDASSPRSQQIRDYLERMGRNGKEAAEIAAHSTRDDKEIHSLGEVMAAHRKLAAEYGNQAESVVRAAQERARMQSREVDLQEQRARDPRRLSGVSVYREAMSDFSVGERIQFTAPDKQLGVANRDLAVVGSIAPDGRITARIDDNREIQFNAAEHRHFDHGYAVTSHSAQGLTAERVLVHADTSVHPDLLSSRFGYVAVSRASHEATIFTDDVARLAQRFGNEVTKSAALEITQPLSMGHQLRLG